MPCSPAARLRGSTLQLCHGATDKTGSHRVTQNTECSLLSTWTVLELLLQCSCSKAVSAWLARGSAPWESDITDGRTLTQDPKARRCMFMQNPCLNSPASCSARTSGSRRVIFSLALRNSLRTCFNSCFKFWRSSFPFSKSVVHIWIWQPNNVKN